MPICLILYDDTDAMETDWAEAVPNTPFMTTLHACLPDYQPDYTTPAEYLAALAGQLTSNANGGVDLTPYPHQVSQVIICSHGASGEFNICNGEYTPANFIGAVGTNPNNIQVQNLITLLQPYLTVDANSTIQANIILVSCFVTQGGNTAMCTALANAINGQVIALNGNAEPGVTNNGEEYCWTTDGSVVSYTASNQYTLQANPGGGQQIVHAVPEGPIPS